jgi:hypothetical protein
MESIEITRIGPADWQALQHIGRQTFEETFAPHNTLIPVFLKKNSKQNYRIPIPPFISPVWELT